MAEVAVIIPIYNVEKYLCRCVDSVLGQSFEDITVVLVDDGSTDNCYAICEEYAKKDHRVQIIHQKNGGLSAARNAGLDWVLAKQNMEWVFFVDSDDWIHKDTLRLLYEAVQQTNVCIGVAKFEVTRGEKLSTEERDYIFKSEIWNTEQYYVMNNANATVACGKLYHRSCFEHIRYPIGRIHEDEFTTYKVLFRFSKLLVIDKALYAYYQNSEGITASKWSLRKIDILDAFEERICFFNERQNDYMVQYAKEQYDLMKAQMAIQARKNHLNKSYPEKYKMGLLDAICLIERIVGTDKYEMIMVKEYPVFIKAQAYWRRIRRIMYQVGKALYDRKKHFKDKISIVCIAKYEEPYIKEWVEFHLLQGIDRIYVYDNESPDTMKEVLQPYIDAGKVVYTFLPGKARQLDAYNDAIRRFKHETKYMAFIDCDEFLLPERPSVSLIDTIEEIMKQDKNSGGIAVNWRMYGSSGLLHKPDGLVIENYLYRGEGAAKGNDCIKTIANPRLIKHYDHVHYPTYYAGIHSVNEDGKPVCGWSNPCSETKRIRINHYFTKSKEEWIVRRSYGKADAAADYPRTIDEFYEHDHHDVYDPIMLPYAKALREKGLKE